MKKHKISLLSKLKTMSFPRDHCHSRAGGNPQRRNSWIPAFAGMTRFNLNSNDKIYNLLLVMISILAVDAFISSTTAFSQMPIQTNINSYNVSPLGVYDRIQLVPRDPLTTCAPGTMYVNKTNSLLYICDNSNTFSFTDSVWKQSNAGISFKDTANLTTLRVGIGTSVPEFKLTLNNDGGILAKGRLPLGTGAILPDDLTPTPRFIWYPRKAAFRAGHIDPSLDTSLPTLGAQWTDAYIGNHSVAFGNSTVAFGESSVAVGGVTRAFSDYSTILGGRLNTIDEFGNAPSRVATIIGGTANEIHNSGHAFIGGGHSNNIIQSSYSENYSSILGGSGNYINGKLSFIGGGGDWDNEDPWLTGRLIYPAENGNKIGFTTTSNYSVISGGFQNKINGGALSTDYNTISGGESNVIRGAYNTISGGDTNYILINASSDSTYSTISGGKNNLITRSNYSTIAGGATTVDNHSIVGDYSIIIGGTNHSINANYATIGGGTNNTINAGADYSFIGSHTNSTALGPYATIAGSGNSTAEDYSFVGGGSLNDATGQYAVIPGGEGNTASGNYSFAGSNSTTVSGANSFGWKGNTFTVPNTFNIFKGGLSSTGTVAIGTSAPSASDSLFVNGTTKVTGTLSINPVSVVGVTALKATALGQVGRDLAEIFETSQDVEAGDVLVIDEAQKIKLKKSESAYDKKVIGVVSGAPAIVFKGNSIDISLDAKKFTKGKNPPVALSGRVPCKVTLENGPIEMGDLLTTSSTPGYAMKADRNLDKSFGKIIGRAMESFKGESSGEKTGMITIFVTLH